MIEILRRPKKIIEPDEQQTKQGGFHEDVENQGIRIGKNADDQER
jgi:hypothetical protein